MSTTRDAETNGSDADDTTRPHFEFGGSFSTWAYIPAAVNQGYTPFYKMMGWDSGIPGWQSWENNTGDEANRPAAIGIQTTGTIVAAWFVQFGF